MKKIIILSFILTCSYSVLKAQNSLSISTDAPSLAFGGFALEGGLNHNKTRFALSLNQLKLPDFSNPDFATVSKYRKSLNLQVTKFVRTDQTGLHYGLKTGYVLSEELSLLDANGDIDPNVPSLDQSYFTVGVVAGFFWHPFKKNDGVIKGLFLEPNIGVNYAISKDDITMGTKLIEKKPLSMEVPKLNIGWKFQF